MLSALVSLPAACHTSNNSDCKSWLKRSWRIRWTLCPPALALTGVSVGHSLSVSRASPHWSPFSSAKCPALGPTVLLSKLTRLPPSVTSPERLRQAAQGRRASTLLHSASSGHTEARFCPLLSRVTPGPHGTSLVETFHHGVRGGILTSKWKRSVFPPLSSYSSLGPSK